MQTDAAVVTAYDRPPAYLPYDLPDPEGAQYVVDVLAAGLHPRVRSAAAGRHYTSTGALPMVPGVDAVGRRADGTLVYFVSGNDVVGTMAARAVVDPRRAIELPPGVDAVLVAAAMNPAMSSWVALRRQVPIPEGAQVLVLGATGNAGSAAVRVARLLGAGRVVGAGRDRARLAALPADEVVALTPDAQETAAALAAAAADVDIVLDYLWGDPAATAMRALLTARGDRSRRLDWVQIGAVAGPELPLPSELLRQANLRVQGVGQGAVSPREYLAQLPSLVAAIGAGSVPLTVRPEPLADVAAVWPRPDVPGERVVLVP